MRIESRMNYGMDMLKDESSCRSCFLTDSKFFKFIRQPITFSSQHLGTIKSKDIIKKNRFLFLTTNVIMDGSKNVIRGRTSYGYSYQKKGTSIHVLLDASTH